ncbi:uncharacterized protein LOC134825137 [Bolinopsis microptera]|uniref:uncharacterized protein LOC134825137 n=1 Tax=Bolinopsis microptera TaxID=2820187 RepID=UPI00307A1C74
MGNLLLLTALLILAVDAQDDCTFKNKQLRKKEDLYNECLDEGYKSSIVGCAATGGESDLSKREKKRCRKVEEDLILCDWSCVVNGDWGEFGEWSECSAACGGGTQTRKRSCDDPQPAEGGAQCEGDEGETRVCNVDPCPPRLPSWPEDFKWSNAGVPDGYTCMRVLEFAEPKDHTWEDNFFCWKNGLADPGLRWSMAGEIAGQKCVQITEAADPDTWTDNYICLPLDTPYNFKWSSAGPLEGLKCIQWLEPADPDTWNDNYLCHEKLEGPDVTAFLPSWPDEFKWSNAGVPDGYTCMRVLEFAEPKDHTWEDNFFCWKNGLADPGLRWSMAGEIEGQKCVQITEAADPDTWTDNYICLPLDTPYDLKWSSAGPLEGLECIQWLEPADPDTWDDNYLCHSWWHQDPSLKTVNGAWTHFGKWSECSASCGTGTQSRKRSCENPSPLHGGAGCEGDEEETQACNTKPCPVRLPSWPEDFKWSSAGVPDGYTCMRVLEFAEPKEHTWEDNFFCWKNGLADPGLRWSMAGEIAGQKCVQITEAADPHTWTDNYICLPLKSPYDLKWSSAGPIEGLECIQWLETSDPDTWDDNYLCHGTFEGPEIVNHLPDWPEDFKWSNAGVPDGYTCMRVLEFAEPKEHTWEDNFFCWMDGMPDPGLRWSMAGAIEGQKCVQITEAADPHTWTDNYICLPLDTPYDFKWSSAGPLKDLECIQWLEPADPDTWDDNYLCFETMEF